MNVDATVEQDPLQPPQADSGHQEAPSDTDSHVVLEDAVCEEIFGSEEVSEHDPSEATVTQAVLGGCQQMLLSLFPRLLH